MPSAEWTTPRPASSDHPRSAGGSAHGQSAGKPAVPSHLADQAEPCRSDRAAAIATPRGPTAPFTFESHLRIRSVEVVLSCTIELCDDLGPPIGEIGTAQVLAVSIALHDLSRVAARASSPDELHCADSPIRRRRHPARLCRQCGCGSRRYRIDETVRRIRAFCGDNISPSFQSPQTASFGGFDPMTVPRGREQCGSRQTSIHAFKHG